MKSFAIPTVVAAVILATLGYFYFTGEDLETYIEERGHVHVAPRGGTLIEMGDHAANIEILHDSGTGELIAYLLDAHAENPVRSAEKTVVVQIRTAEDQPWTDVTLDAVANVLSSETVGDTSEFRATAEILSGVQTFEIQVPPMPLRGVELSSEIVTVQSDNAIDSSEY